MKAAEVKKLRQVKDSIGTCQTAIWKTANGPEANEGTAGGGRGSSMTVGLSGERPLSVSLLLGPRVVPWMLVRLKAR